MTGEVMSYDVASCDIASCDIASCDIASYGGPLTDAHFRAVARVALGASGLPPLEGQVRHLPSLMSTGRDLRDSAIPEMLASKAQTDGRHGDQALADKYRSLAQEAPWAWQRLPYAIAFGVACARALHRCALSEDDGRTKVPAAALSAAALLLDSSAERGTGSSLVSEVAGALLTRCAGLTAGLTDDEHLRQVFVARLGAIGAPTRGVGDAAQVEDLEARPIAAALALADLVELAIAPHRRLPSQVWRELRRLGRARCLADDLADLALDARCGQPNMILARHSRRAARLSEPEMYGAIYAGAAELAGLLISEHPGPSERADGSAGPLTAGPLTAEPLTALRELQAAVVARLDWPAGKSYASGMPGVAPVRDGLRSRLQLTVEALVEEASTGFAQSGHHLCFPRGRQGATRHETHVATLLVRAVTLDALLDARVAGLGVADAVLCREAMALLLAKHAMVRGGWSYIDAVPELPPDADDLGQVLQELVRVGGTELACACDEAVSLVLGARRTSGGFATWVLDPSAPGTLDREMSEYISVIGGTGAHPEVVANLLGGLQLYDPARFGTEIREGAAYLERKQDRGGWWDSTWYAGRFYGTYKAVAMLASLSSGTEATRRALAFLESTQRDDGGWGETSSDPLATAHALLAHACIGQMAECRQRGTTFLLGTQRKDGTWPAAAWVQFPTLNGLQSYSSSAVTTAFALRACLAAVDEKRVEDDKRVETVSATDSPAARAPALVAGGGLPAWS